jgi:hypothetical protein
MASPQTAVNFNIPVGIPGEIAYDVPLNAQVRLIHSGGVNPNVFGYAYTESTYVAPTGTNQAPQSATVGGTGVFAGILLQPKAASSAGGTTGSLSTTFNLLEDSYGTLGTQGAFFVNVSSACAIGDHVSYDTTTGSLATVAPQAYFTGAIAVTTGILTVSAMGSGSPAIAIGETLTGTGVAAGTIITGFLTGTNGGVGTYSTNVTAAVSSTATMKTGSAAAAGTLKIPNTRIAYFALSAAGVAVVKITGAN